MAQFLSVGMSLLGAGGGLLGAHHKNAVAAEQGGIGAADAQIQGDFDAIRQAFVAGMISAADAKSQVDQAVANYGANTASIRTGGAEYFPNRAGGKVFDGVRGKCNAACVVWAGWADKGNDLKKFIDSATPVGAQSTAQKGQIGILQSSAPTIAKNVSYPQAPVPSFFSGLTSFFSGSAPSRPALATADLGTVPYAQGDVAGGPSQAMFAVLAIGALVVMVVLFRAKGGR